MVGVTAAAGDTAMKYDLLIHKGQVVDGTGNPAFRADIGVVADKIVEIGRLNGGAERVIEGTIKIEGTGNRLALLIGAFSDSSAFPGPQGSGQGHGR
jgi:hypothetical protein